MSRRGAPRLALAPMAVLVLLSGGCGTADRSDLEAYVNQVRAREPTPIEPLPEIRQVRPFVYEPGDRRDPFVADTRVIEAPVAKPGTSLAPDPRRRKEALEAYALEALRMVGTLERDATRWGLIRTQDGILHRVRVGNYLGTNNGQITSISDEAIQLTEIVSDGPDAWRERPATVQLRR